RCRRTGHPSRVPSALSKNPDLAVGQDLAELGFEVVGIDRSPGRHGLLDLAGELLADVAAQRAGVAHRQLDDPVLERGRPLLLELAPIGAKVELAGLAAGAQDRLL